MKIEAYSSFSEWKADLDRMHQHPNDKHLSTHVVNRINASSNELKAEIREYLLDKALEDNPWMVLQKAAIDHPDFRVVVRHPQDPWFVC